MSKNVYLTKSWIAKDINGQPIPGGYSGGSSSSASSVDLSNFYTIPQIDSSFYTKSQADSNFVNITGDTMTGALNVDLGAGYKTYIGSNAINFNRNTANYIQAETSGGYLIFSTNGETYGTSPGMVLDTAKKLTVYGIIDGKSSLYVQGSGIYQTGSGDKFIQMGNGRTDNANSYIDLIGDPTYTDYGLRVIRTSGLNGNSEIKHRGTGALRFYTQEEADIDFFTNGTQKVIIDGATGTLETQSIEADGSVYLDGLKSNDTFTSGFLGTGMQLWKDTNDKWTGEWDNQTIRETLWAYILEVIETRSTKGPLIVSPGGVRSTSDIQWDSTYHNYYFEIGEGEDYLYEDDIIYSARQTGSGVHSQRYVVQDTSNGKVYLGSFPEVYATANADNYQSFTGYSGAVVTEYISGVTGVDIDFSDSTEYALSGAIDVSKGWLRVEINNGLGYSGTAKISFRNGSSVLKSNYVEWAENGIFYLNIEEDVTGGKIWIQTDSTFSVQYADIVLYAMALDGTSTANGYEWGVFGNLSNEDRQNLIYLTPGDDNGPKIIFYTGVNSATITDDNKRMVLGDLQGETYDGEGLGGFGALIKNLIASGKIIATSGTIGGLEIVNNTLTATGDGGTLIIDGDNQSITIYDSNGAERIRINPNAATPYDDLIGSTSDEWVSADLTSADISTDCSSNQTTSENRYIVSNYASSTTDDRLKQATSYDIAYKIDVTANKSYNLTFQFDLQTDYSLEADDTDETNGITIAHSLSGTFNMKFKIIAYDKNSTQLWDSGFLYHNFLSPTDAFATIKTITLANNTPIGLVTQDGVYFRLYYDITRNSVKQKNNITYWEYNTGEWIESGSATTYTSINLSVRLDMKYVKLAGASGLTELSSQGLVSAWDTNRYFSIDGSTLGTEADPFIKSDGYWEHDGSTHIAYAEIDAANLQVIKLNLGQTSVTNGDTISSGDNPNIVWNYYTSGTLTMPSANDGDTYFITNQSSNVCTINKSGSGFRYNGTSTGASYSLGGYRTIIAIYNDGYWHLNT